MDVLFEYLRQILFEPGKAGLDMSKVSEQDRTMAQGLQYLEACMKELRVFAKGLSKGDLNTPLPAPDNPLTGEIKALHGALSHLVWQAKQVTKGDYQQKIDFMGEISETFNTMTVMLAEREYKLEQEAEEIRQANEMLQQSQSLLNELIERLDEWVVVSSPDSETLYYKNKAYEYYHQLYPALQDKLKEAFKNNGYIDNMEALKWETVIQLDAPEERFFVLQIRSQQVNWNGRNSYNHIIKDVTKEREAENAAYVDVLTGLFNRRYGMKEIKRRTQAGQKFGIAFVDMDLLKFVNDTYGHESGDAYIKETARVIDQVEGPKVICRIGGDEFLVIAERYQDLEEQLEQIRKRFIDSSDEYKRSFSFGVINSDAGFTDVSEMLKQADIKMYEYKIRHKRQRID